MTNILVAAIAGGLAALILPIISKKLLKLSDSAALTFQKIGVVICAIAAVNLYPIYNSYKSTEKLDKEISKAVEQAKTTEGESVTDILRENSIKTATNELNDKSMSEKQVTAASQFFGFYLINVRTRKAHCSNLGVAIPNFIKEFESENKNEFIRARRILKTTTEIENNYYLTSKADYEKILNLQMPDQAKQFNVTEKELCQSIENDAANIAKLMRFSETLPLQAKILNEL